MIKLLIFFVYPVLELYCLVQAGEYIGGLGVVAAVVIGMMLGGWIIQTHSRNSFAQAQGELRAGRIPQNALLDSILVLLAGLLFIIPGFISDIAALLLLIPAVRTACARKVISYFQAQQKKGEAGFKGTFIYSNRARTPKTDASGGFTPFADADKARSPVDEGIIIDCTAEPAHGSEKNCTYSESDKRTFEASPNDAKSSQSDAKKHHDS